jgi:hypothetical protein
MKNPSPEMLSGLIRGRWSSVLFCCPFLGATGLKRHAPTMQLVGISGEIPLSEGLEYFERR